MVGLVLVTRRQRGRRVLGAGANCVSSVYGWALRLSGTEGMHWEVGKRGRNERVKRKDRRETNQEVLIKLQQTLRVSELRGNPMC